MQALKQPESGGANRGVAVARSKWRRIFYLLTAFNIVTVSGALYLAYQVLTLYRQEERRRIPCRRCGYFMGRVANSATGAGSGAGWEFLSSSRSTISSGR